MRALLCVFVCASASVGYGAILTPGGPAGPEGIAPTGTVIATNLATVPLTLSPNLISQVIQGDTTNPLGGLTFTFQLTGHGTLPGSSGGDFPFQVLGFSGIEVDGSYYYPTVPPNTDPGIHRPRMYPLMGADGEVRTRGLTYPNGIPRFIESSVIVLRTGLADYALVGDLEWSNQLNPNGPTTHDVLFAPVPEPSSIFLVVAGLLSVAFIRRGYVRS